MDLSRRELLGGLGLGSLAWAFGCGGSRQPTVPPAQVEAGGGEVRSWLRDAIERLAATFPAVHALAVTRRRTVAAIDVLGATTSRARRDGLTIVVRDRDGWHEHATSDVSEAGVAALVKQLVGTSAKRITLAVQVPRLGPAVRFTEDELRNRAAAITRMDKLDSRAVYAAAIVELDDAHVWSIAASDRAAPHDREQQLVRVRERVVRAAWNGARPVIGEAEHAWQGRADDRRLDEADVKRAARLALELMTPGGFDEGERTVLLEPTVVASLVDAGTRALLTTAAARRPEVKRTVAIGAQIGSAMLTLVDDPTTRAAYGGFQFDDEGELAAPITLIDGGRIAGTLADRAGGGRGRGRRPGHVGPVEPAPSHLRLVAGRALHDDLREDGFLLEGGTGALVDPSTTRVVIGAQRAREIRGGKETGRVYADVELVGNLAALLAAVTGVSSDTAMVGYRDERDDEPRWRSIEAPWLRTRGFVRARRRA